MKELNEFNIMMVDIIENWKKTKRKIRARSEYFADSADVTCSICGKELLYTGGKEHRLGPFWDYEVACGTHGKQGTKIVEIIQQWEEDHSEPARPFDLSKEEYKLLGERLSAFFKWVGKEQPKGAGAVHDYLAGTKIGEEFKIFIVARDIMVFEIDGARFCMSKKVINKIKRVYRKAGGKIKEGWNDVDGTNHFSIRMKGDMVATTQLYEFYDKGCQRYGLYKGPDGKKIGHDRKSVFCNCTWLESARKKVKYPEGWE